ncbi:MAG: hypothetical protein EA411_07550 [Saprospirales bacterium]|nr:MAG: hypothetical protein EA411_07550 [Saprospirales bacterium]
MKSSDQFIKNPRSIAVTAICGLALVGVLVVFLWNIENPYNMMAYNLIFAVSGVLLNRLLPPSEKVARLQFRILRLVTETLFTIGLVGVIVWCVFYETRSHFFELLLFPIIILAGYLLIKYTFGPHAHERR